MTQQPYPPEPPTPYGQPPIPPYDLPYYGTPAGSPDRLPTSATVIGIFGVILGSLGVLRLLFLLLLAVALTTIPQLATAARRSNSTATSPVQIGLGLVFGVLAIAELAGSIGLLRRAEWGRRLMVLWAVADPVLAMVGTLVSVAYVIPQTLARARPSATPVTMMAPFLYGTAVVGLMFTLVLPAFALVYLRRPHVRAACARP